ncbi:MAG: dihydrofolate reductase [Clostridia bacterium]|nr:dihydrofolate reductase [Clostridia bacterium]
MIQIVNIAKHNAIGKGGDLLVSIPEDMKFFRETTRGGVLILGRKTLESFPNGAPLKGRVNIVLTHDPESVAESAYAAAERDRAEGKQTELIAVTTAEEAVNAAARYPERGEPFVIGGASVYRELLPLCDTCLVTENDADDPEADTFYPELSPEEWRCAAASDPKEHEGIRYRFCRYERIK